MSRWQNGLWFLAAALAFCLGAFVWVRYVRTPKDVAYVTEEEGGISVIDLDTLKIIRRIQPPDVQPRGIAVTLDGKYIVTANKNTSDIAVFSTPRLGLVKRIHVGHSPEFIKVDSGGHRLFATFEPGSSGAVPGSPGPKDDADEENEPPAQIASFRIADWSPGPVATAGRETEGLEFSPDGKYLLVANEAQDDIGIFAADTGALIRNVHLKPYGIRPRAIKVSPLHNEYSVTMEASGTLLKMDMNFNVLKSVPTAAKPYGEAFDRAGKRIFVAAALAGKLQVFDADSLNLLAEVPIGKRCWHFTFTPDDSKILLACGRSNNIVVVDPNSYKPIATIEGLSLPWGIVTYPQSYGSLGLP
jgi:YVTN family beta-propeller protein